MGLIGSGMGGLISGTILIYKLPKPKLFNIWLNPLGWLGSWLPPNPPITLEKMLAKLGIPGGRGS